MCYLIQDSHQRCNFDILVGVIVIVRRRSDAKVDIVSTAEVDDCISDINTCTRYVIYARYTPNLCPHARLLAPKIPHLSHESPSISTRIGGISEHSVFLNDEAHGT